MSETDAVIVFCFFFVQPLSGAKDRPHNDSDYS